MTITSSPSPDPQSDHMSHTYQAASEGSDHSLLGHSHQCLCTNERAESPTSKLAQHCTHVHLLNNQLSAPPSHALHVHAASIHASPKSSGGPARGGGMKALSTCTCHGGGGGGGGADVISVNTPTPDIHETGGIAMQGRLKLDADDSIEVSPLPPALPPRPPPRQRFGDGSSTFGLRNNYDGGVHGGSGNGGGAPGGMAGGGIRKYVFWCCACGGAAALIGALFLAVYFMLRSYTSTLGYFETIPTFVPATMLILTGLCVMSLARRKNRFSYLIKVSGACCLVCALTCVLVTITTTVIHMNRLQTLRECVYTQKTRTCTCYSVLLEHNSGGPVSGADLIRGIPPGDDTPPATSMRFVFDATPDCEVIHGALYSCLRAMFGLSVSGILVCIFSCMLVYQLLSHERKKMYWEQLELRCRSLYQHQGTAQGSMRGPPVALGPGPTYCSCCDECRYTSIPSNPHMYPWDTHALDRFWTPGRVGNFYSPNPGEEMGSISNNVGGVSTVQQQNVNELGNNRSTSRSNNTTGWNWRRLPWSRNGCPETRVPASMSYPPAISSPDSQYGFSSVNSGNVPNNMIEQISSSTTGGYTVLADRPVGAYLWGPPPPYSNPDSPARRGVGSPARYHHPPHVHHAHHPHLTHCQLNDDNQQRSSDCHQHRSRGRIPHFMANKDNYENTPEAEQPHHHIANESTSETTDASDRASNTLPARKTKKRVDMMSVKSVSGGGANFRANIQNVFSASQDFNDTRRAEESDEHSYQEPNLKREDNASPIATSSPELPKCRYLPRLQGVENPAFQNQEPNNVNNTGVANNIQGKQSIPCSSGSTPQQNSQKSTEPTESEVYFADVSSCCNISVRNDGPDSSLYDEASENKQPKPRLMSLQNLHKTDRENTQINKKFQDPAGILPTNITEEEDYLSHRIGKRQMSTRSRLPFPLPSNTEECHEELSANTCLLPKDLSQSSLCSSVQTPNTDTTDLDIATPVSQGYPSFYPDDTTTNSTTLHSRIRDQQPLAPDAQYEVIQQPNNYQGHFSERQNFSNLTNTISGLNNFGNQSFGNQSFAYNPCNPISTSYNPTINSANFSYTNGLNESKISFNSNFPENPANVNNFNYTQGGSPKHIKQLNTSPRKNIGSNISTLIQNLGGSPVGLLYGDVNSAGDEEEEIEAVEQARGGGNNSDGTMDSGWQSESDRIDGLSRVDSGEEETCQRPVNV